jgi:hypothetical protein
MHGLEHLRERPAVRPGVGGVRYLKRGRHPVNQISILLTPAVLMMVSCTASPEGTTATESTTDLFQPKPLDDEWSRWIVGQWEGSAEGDPRQKWSGTFETGLNGQFLMYRSDADLATMPPEQAQLLKEHAGASNEDIERFKSLPYRALEVYTIDPRNGEVVGYLFDSLRCVAAGRGKLAGNTQTIHWEWSVCGQGTSTRITEKVGEDKLLITETNTWQDGTTSEGKGVMVRRKRGPER